jgi:hypothetical protein
MRFSFPRTLISNSDMHILLCISESAREIKLRSLMRLATCDSRDGSLAFDVMRERLLLRRSTGLSLLYLRRCEEISRIDAQSLSDGNQQLQSRVARAAFEILNGAPGHVCLVGEILLGPVARFAQSAHVGAYIAEKSFSARRCHRRDLHRTASRANLKSSCEPRGVTARRERPFDVRSVHDRLFQPQTPPRYLLQKPCLAQDDLDVALIEFDLVATESARFCDEFLRGEFRLRSRR